MRLRGLVFGLALALWPSQALATQPPDPVKTTPSVFVGVSVGYSDLRLLGGWSGAGDGHGVAWGARLGTFVGDFEVGVRGAGAIYGGEQNLLTVGPEVTWFFLDEPCCGDPYYDDCGSDEQGRWHWYDRIRSKPRLSPQLRLGGGGGQLSVEGDGSAGGYAQLGLGATYGWPSFEFGVSVDGTVFVAGPGSAFILQPQVELVVRF